MLRSTGVAVFRSPFHFLYCQTYRGGLSIYRKFRVKISTRSAYLFGASIIRGAFGRHIGNFRRTFIFHCVALLSVYSLPGICSGGSFSNRPVGFVFRNRGTYQQRTPPLLPLLLVRRTPPVNFKTSFTLSRRNWIASTSNKVRQYRVPAVASGSLNRVRISSGYSSGSYEI